LKRRFWTLAPRYFREALLWSGFGAVSRLIAEESGNPNTAAFASRVFKTYKQSVGFTNTQVLVWIPAYAGMTAFAGFVK
jgi:hypothetical protein